MAGACRFFMSSTNPNDQIGGGGCVCGETKNLDQKGPFAVFPGTTMDSGCSPHVVVCFGCAEAIVEAGEGEMLSSSADILESEAVELPVNDEDIPEL
ncbi:MAG: hypothetical protein ACXVGB_00635 [Mycobacteriaceae bacterium]